MSLAGGEGIKYPKTLSQHTVFFSRTKLTNNNLAYDALLNKMADLTDEEKHQLILAAMDSCHARGKRLMDDLVTTLLDAHHEDKVYYPHEDRYTVEGDTWETANLPIGPLITARGGQNESIWTVQVEAKPNQTPPGQPRRNRRNAPDFDYLNGFSPSRMVCVQNNKSHDTANPSLPLSEILFQGYREGVWQLSPSQDPEAALDLTGLRECWQCHVVNTVSMRVASACLDDGQTRFVRGEDNFYALLGTPNCGTIVRMLMDHADELGAKYVEAIEIHQTPVADTGKVNLFFCIEIGEYADIMDEDIVMGDYIPSDDDVLMEDRSPSSSR